jgi:uncharacterized membrane protein YphA (DoxX/SURF4 family)
MIKGQSLSQQETVQTGGLARYTTAFAPYALTILRALVGITFLLHGLPKLSGLEGFTGFVGSLGIPLPGFVAILIVALEVGGGLLLILGLATRWVSLLFALEMLVTTLLVKLPNAASSPRRTSRAPAPSSTCCCWPPHWCCWPLAPASSRSSGMSSGASCDRRGRHDTR